MSLPRLALAVIGDEIGPSLDEMISFCGENQVRRLDMRTVEGRNLLGMSLEDLTTVIVSGFKSAFLPFREKQDMLKAVNAEIDSTLKRFEAQQRK